MESNDQNFSPYLDNEKDSNSPTDLEASRENNVTENNSKTASSSENNITDGAVITPGSEDIIAGKLDHQDPYVKLLKDSVPTDSTTRRRIAYSILRAMLLSKKGAR